MKVQRSRMQKPTMHILLKKKNKQLKSQMQKIKVRERGKKRKGKQKTAKVQSSHVTQRVKDPPLSLQWLKSLMWHRLNPWLGNFCIPWIWPKTKQNKKTH